MACKAYRIQTQYFRTKGVTEVGSLITIKTNGKSLKRGFTLIELLVVIAIIAVLLAILQPALSKAKHLSRRLYCQANLKNIALAWNMYLDDHDGRFYQNTTGHYTYGGWNGTSNPDKVRPLNPYLSIPEMDASKAETKVFKCPADDGRVSTVGMIYYEYFGTSYQTNLLLIGQNQLGNYLPNDPGDTLTNAINDQLKNNNVNKVGNHSEILLIGDFEWAMQWQPNTNNKPREPEWHRRDYYHNLAFLDSHVEYLRIRRGLAITSQYRVMPFRVLYKQTLDWQVEDEEY